MQVILLVLSCCGSFVILTVAMKVGHMTWLIKDKRAASWQNQQNGICAHPSLIRIFAVRMKKAWVLSYPLSARQRLWSDWADAQVFTRRTVILLVLSWGGSKSKPKKNYIPLPWQWSHDFFGFRSQVGLYFSRFHTLRPQLALQSSCRTTGCHQQ